MPKPAQPPPLSPAGAEWWWAWEGQSCVAEATAPGFFLRGIGPRTDLERAQALGDRRPAIRRVSGPAPDLFWGTSLPRRPLLPSGLGVVGRKSLAKDPALWIWVWGKGRWRGQLMDSLISQQVRAS